MSPVRNGIKKILFVNPYAGIRGLTGESCGCGAEESLYLLIKNLNKEKYEPVVVYPSPKRSYDSILRYNELKTKLIFLPMPVLKRKLKFFELIFLPFSSIISIIFFCILIIKLKIDIVHTNTPQVFTSGIAGKICGIKSIYHIRQLIEKPKFLRKLLVYLINFISDEIICISNPVADMFRNVSNVEPRFIGTDLNKVHVIFNGVNLNRYSIKMSLRGAERRSNLIKNEFKLNNEKIVGTIGRLHPRKGYIDFLKSAKFILKSLRDIKFFIVGDIDNKDHRWYKKDLRDFINKNNLKENVILTGFRDDIPEIMSEFDCFVLASNSEKSPEPFGRVIIEAMAAGTPVVATNQGGVTDIIIHEKTGILIPPGNPEKMADAILKILKDDKFANSLSIESRKRVESLFELSKSVSETEKIYNKI